MQIILLKISVMFPFYSKLKFASFYTNVGNPTSKTLVKVTILPEKRS